MNEHEWLTSTDPAAMLRWITAEDVDSSWRPTDRQLSLFIAACCHKRGDDEEFLRKVEAGFYVGSRATDAISWATTANEKKGEPSKAEMASYLREIFGNPFRKRPEWVDGKLWEVSHIELNGSRVWPEAIWLTPAIHALAASIYENRDWSAMPALGDMLEEVRCRNESVLRHCRGKDLCGECLGSGQMVAEKCQWCNGTGWWPLLDLHVRGCWVIELILGETR